MAAVARADVPNGIRRLYSRAVLDRAVAAFKALPPRSMLGTLGERPVSAVVPISQASHTVLDLIWQDDYLLAEIEPMTNTPTGYTLTKLLDASQGLVAFRLTGVGPVTLRPDGVVVIGDSYQLVSVDAWPAQKAAALG
jgi:hypothetical protein